MFRKELQKQPPEVFCKKNFIKFTGKHLCQSLLFNSVAGLRHATFLKKRLWHRCFPVKFVIFLRTTFFNRTPPVAPSRTYYLIVEIDIQLEHFR